MKKKWSQNPKIQQICEDAYMGISVDENTLYNPLMNVPSFLDEEPHVYYTWLLLQPEYFSLICKEIFNINLLPFQLAIIYELWHRKFPMLIASRGASKSFMLGLYCLLRLLLLDKRKIVICGAGFRQSKIIFNYMESIYNNAPILRDILGPDNGPKRDVDTWTFKINQSIAYAIPIGDGEKIRGLRANDVLGDEFASISQEIFEKVISGFAAVSANPVESVQNFAAKNIAKEHGFEIEEDDKYTAVVPNQIVISGTADYDFHHFAAYWKRWRDIITAKGDLNKLSQYRDKVEDVSSLIDYKNYSIIRLPVELLPPKFMDEAQISRSRATMHTGIYESEFGAVFSKDSLGYYKRSLIESCSVTQNMDMRSFPEGASLFTACLRGNPNKKYIMAIDPAASRDNFSIIILEVYPNHRRVVYCWVTNDKEHKEKVAKGIIKENDYYSYCCRKIRDLMVLFSCEYIALDTQGGGKAIEEGLHDTDKLLPGEQPLWPVIDPESPEPTDNYSGLHIIERIQFSDGNWTSEANIGLRKDMEDKLLLFPFFDTVSLGLSAIEDNKYNRQYDTLEDCIFNIEELKNELTTIVMTETATGRDKWDTPEIKLPGGKKGHMKKDRYSALLMANAVARKWQRKIVIKPSLAIGGFAEAYDNNKQDGPLYTGPEWLAKKLEEAYN